MYGAFHVPRSMMRNWVGREATLGWVYAVVNGQPGSVVALHADGIGTRCPFRKFAASVAPCQVRTYGEECRPRTGVGLTKWTSSKAMHNFGWRR